MNFTSHALAEPGIHHLVTLQRTLALELRGDHDGLEMCVVVRHDARLRARQAVEDHFRDFVCRHGVAAAAWERPGKTDKFKGEEASAVSCRLSRGPPQPARSPAPGQPIAQQNPTMNDFSLLIARGRQVLSIEAEAVAALEHRLDESFARACELLLACQGRIVVTGMGKSGHIGNKIAATLASTGSPAFFLHPAEAMHGDVGMITVKDVVLALSNSGETDELLTILPIIKRLDVPLIALTGKSGSTLVALCRRLRST